MDLTYRLCLMQLCRTLNCNFIIQNKQVRPTQKKPYSTIEKSSFRLMVEKEMTKNQKMVDIYV